MTFYRFLVVSRTLQDAARRLVRYWEMRQQIFGDMAFLPMVQTGHGALTAEDVEHLRRGPCMVLPKDANGSTVVYLFRSRLDEDPRGRWQLVR
jgi:hypothetical protein